MLNSWFQGLSLSTRCAIRFRAYLLQREIWIADILRKHVVLEPSKLHRLNYDDLADLAHSTECLIINFD